MPNASPSQPATEALDTRGCTVLVVDDNDQNRELLVAYLEDLACEIREASDGFQALDAIKAKRPDIVLMDVMMPRMSGYQACKHIKAGANTRGVPVIMVTALNEVGDIERAMDSGADDFLTKPVNRVELLARVRSLMRVSVLQRRLDQAVSEVKRLSGDPGT